VVSINIPLKEISTFITINFAWILSGSFAKIQISKNWPNP